MNIWPRQTKNVFCKTAINHLGNKTKTEVLSYKQNIDKINFHILPSQCP